MPTLEDIREEIDKRILDHDGNKEMVMQDVLRELKSINQTMQLDSIDMCNGLIFDGTKEKMAENSNKANFLKYMITLMEDTNSHDVTEYMNLEEIHSIRSLAHIKGMGIHGGDIRDELEMIFYPAYLFAENPNKDFLLDQGLGFDKDIVSPTDFIGFNYEENREQGDIFLSDATVIKSSELSIGKIDFGSVTDDDRKSKRHIVDEDMSLRYFAVGNRLHLTNTELFERYKETIDNVPAILFVSERIGELRGKFPSSVEFAEHLNDYLTGASDMEYLKDVVKFDDADFKALDYLKKSFDHRDKTSPMEVFHDYGTSIEEIMPSARDQLSAVAEVKGRVFGSIRDEIATRFHHATAKEIREGLVTSSNFIDPQPSYPIVKKALDERGFKERSVGKNPEFDEINTSLTNLMNINTQRVEIGIDSIIKEHGYSSSMLSSIERGVSLVAQNSHASLQSFDREYLPHEREALSGLAEIYKASGIISKEDSHLDVAEVISLTDVEAKTESLKHHIENLLLGASRKQVDKSLPQDKTKSTEPKLSPSGANNKVIKSPKPK